MIIIRPSHHTNVSTSSQHFGRKLTSVRFTDDIKVVVGILIEKSEKLSHNFVKILANGFTAVAVILH